MADPLTVIGAVASTVQIIDVLTKAVSALDTLRAQWQSSDIALLSLTSQLGALSAALSKIQEWMQSGIEEMHHQLVIDLSNSITCCKMLATKLYAEINDLQKAPGGSLLTTAKARFVFKRSGVGELQNMVDRQTAALTLLLTACNSKSIAKQQEILGTSGARKRMDRVHEDTESLRGTLDSSSYLSRSTDRSSRLSMRFAFDDQLFSSDTYMAMIRKTVKLSIRSSKKGAPGPEEVVTSISSNAVSSGSVPSQQPLQHQKPTSMSLPQKLKRPVLHTFIDENWNRFGPVSSQQPPQHQKLGQRQVYRDSKTGMSRTRAPKPLETSASTPMSLPLKLNRPVLHKESRPSKLVLLGQGESAKTTFVKQMQWAYASGFSTEDRETWRTTIFVNLATMCHALASICPNVQVQKGISSIHQVLMTSPYPTNLRHAEKFQKLVTKTMEATADQVHDGLKEELTYLIKNIERIYAPTYVPTSEDIFHTRIRTTGIHKHDFDVPDHGPCVVYDVGGERSERKKWRTIFDQDATVLFFVPMDAYDQVLYEDENSNRMQEALFLFESIVNAENWWKESRMFLCFTKYDLFEKKTKSGARPLNDYFPEYEGSATDVVACREYITGRFTDLMRNRDEIGVFYVDATETQHVRDVVETVLVGGHPGSERFFSFERRADSLYVNEEVS